MCDLYDIRHYKISSIQRLMQQEIKPTPTSEMVIRD